MKIILKSVHHKPSASMLDFLENELKCLQKILQIDEARVTLARDHEASPAFRVAFHLVTPGPDVTAATSDHTLRAALLKSFGIMRGKIGHRRLKQSQRKTAPLITAGPRRTAAAGLGRR
jgi:hypothetical protein